MRRYSMPFLSAVLVLVSWMMGTIAVAQPGVDRAGALGAEQDHREVGCSAEPLPEVLHLGEGADLKAGLVYLVKGPVARIDATFQHQFWRESFRGTVHGVALVTPTQDGIWPPDGSDAESYPQEALKADLLDLQGTYDAWQIVRGWRPPFVMFSPLEDPLDEVGLGRFGQGWAVSARVLDHLNHVYQQTDRHAWLSLVRPDGSEVMLHQLEVADPAQLGVTLPAQGDILVRTHDSTVWWTQCAPPPAITVAKTATPSQLPEPGGLVIFSVRVHNNGAVPLTLTTLTDSIYGPLSLGSNPAIASSTCTLPQPLGVSGFYECTFTASVVGSPGDSETDTVTASAKDEFNREVTASASATVAILDVPSSLRVTKTAEPVHAPEPGARISFRVVVENTSSVDSVSINHVLDDQFGDIGATCSPAVPALLPPGGKMTCLFTEFIGGQPGDAHTDVITVTGQDDDGNFVGAHDDATVVIDDVPSAIQVTKAATPHWLYYPGGDVAFRFTVGNLSTVDAVSIEQLLDSAYGNLQGQGDCSLPQLLGVGESYSCTIVQSVTGQPDTTHTNVVTASGRDDDGVPVSDEASATVTIAAVPTRIELLYLQASAGYQQVVVEWETTWEQDNLGFNVYRSTSDKSDEAVLVHFRHAEGTGRFEGHKYRYVDNDVVPGQRYYYWLSDVDAVGPVTEYGPASAMIPFRIFMPLTVRSR